jgi:hypothetical protein
MKQVTVFAGTAMLLVLLAGCNQLGGNSFVPKIPGFETAERKMVILKRPLREISGIDFISNSQLAAINDEAGKLFFLNPDNGKYTVEEFGRKDDYEDVVRAGEYYYVLNSKGSIFEVTSDGKKLEQKFEHPFGKFMEFESLCYDRQNEQLLLVCKECGKNQNSISAYRFDLRTRQYVPGEYFSISWSDIRRMARNDAIECKPSAAAINPKNGKLYIIASLGKVLLQCTTSGTLEAVYGLNPDHFPQPEGITFSSEGDLFIANEGVQGKGTLLKFVYKP